MNKPHFCTRPNSSSRPFGSFLEANRYAALLLRGGAGMVGHRGQRIALAGGVCGVIIALVCAVCAAVIGLGIRNGNAMSPTFCRRQSSHVKEEM